MNAEIRTCTTHPRVSFTTENCPCCALDTLGDDYRSKVNRLETARETIILLEQRISGLERELQHEKTRNASMVKELSNAYEALGVMR